MGADTWVNLVQHRLPPPNATTPPKKPEPKATPTSPTHTPERVSRNESPGWFWMTRKRNTAPLTFTRPSVIDAGSGAVNPVQRVEEDPRSLSRVSSGESWLEVRHSDGSSDDLTDLEDTNLVSVAPRHEPRCRSIRITDLASSASVPSIGGQRLDDSDAAPAGSRSSGSSDAPEPTSMQRAHACDAPEPGAGIPPAGIRMRTTTTKDRTPENCTEKSGEAAAGSSGTAGHDQGEGQRDAEGALSMARVATVCGVAPDSDLLWTFLAGMMLYFMSV